MVTGEKVLSLCDACMDKFHDDIVSTIKLESNADIDDVNRFARALCVALERMAADLRLSHAEPGGTA